MPVRDQAVERGVRRGRKLEALVEAQEGLLVASAIAAGLGRIRKRSAPSRLAVEARRFARLLEAHLGSPDREALVALAQEELRTGAFAVSSPEQRAEVVDLWRRLLPPILAGAGRAADARRVERAFDRIERTVTHAAIAWDAQRIDIVVIGASAGGLQALTDLVGALDAALPATFLVVLHVSERSPGLIPMLLTRHTGLEVAWAVDGAALHLGHAFVAPPGRHLLVGAEALSLVQGPPVRFVRPSVDTLFSSAAQTFGHRVAAVVLSGTGADGAAGIRAVRAHGGVTFAQEPTAADFRGMPDSAIATGSVERVLRADRIGEALRLAVARGRGALAKPLRV